MAGNRAQSRKMSSKIAFCGMMVALSIALMLSGGIIPIATYCVPMFTGMLLLPVLMEYGKKAAWTAYAATALIALVLGIDKEAAFFYLFLGFYPLIKWDIELMRHQRLRLAIKLLYFNGAFAAMYALLGFLLHMDAVVAEFASMGKVMFVVFALLLNLCMLLYDRLLLPMSLMYANRLRPKLRFLDR